MDIYAKFANMVNAEELAESQKEINDNAASSGNFPQIPSGEYKVRITKMEVTTPSWGGEQVSIQFTIVEGNYANSCIFYNQGYDEDWKRHPLARFLADVFDTNIYEQLEKKNCKIPDGTAAAFLNDMFKSCPRVGINEFLLDMHESIDADGMEYLLSYKATPKKSKNGKDYTKKDFAVLEIYDK